MATRNRGVRTSGLDPFGAFCKNKELDFGPIRAPKEYFPSGSKKVAEKK